MLNRIGLNSQLLKADLSFGKNGSESVEKHPYISIKSTMNTKTSNNEVKPQLQKVKNEELKTKSNANGEFNGSRALNQFGKGFISPITKMFASVENFAISVGIGAIMGAAIKASNKVAPIIVAGTALYGGFNIASGINKVIKNQGDHFKQEDSFYDIGKGTGIVVASALPAKGALKAAECKVSEDIHPIMALGKCIAKSPKLLVASSKEILSSSNNMKSLLVGFVPGSGNSVNGAATTGGVINAPGFPDIASHHNVLDGLDGVFVHSEPKRNNVK